jgi:hypothetical protein
VTRATTTVVAGSSNLASWVSGGRALIARSARRMAVRTASIGADSSELRIDS